MDSMIFTKAFPWVHQLAKSHRLKLLLKFPRKFSVAWQDKKRLQQNRLNLIFWF